MPSHPRADAQSENEGDMNSSGTGGDSERSSDEEDMDASQDELPAVEKQGKAARGVPAF